MSLAIVLFFAFGTFIEIYFLKVVSDYISIINTLSLINGDISYNLLLTYDLNSRLRMVSNS